MEGDGPDESVQAELAPSKDSLEAEFERLEGLNEQWKEFSGSYRPRGGDADKDKKLEAMQNTADRSDSLQEHYAYQNEHIQEQAIAVSEGTANMREGV